jgi:hypothetical protein
MDRREIENKDIKKRYRGDVKEIKRDRLIDT